MTIATRPFTVALTETEAMAGVQKKLIEMTTGFRLILENRLKFALLLRRETEMVMNGLQTSRFHTQAMESAGNHIKDQMTRLW